MNSFDAYFPYGQYRPQQQEMLAFAATIARDGGIGMIDAPTGSGKSSVIASLLAERGSRKVLIAVRTKSQLETFLREAALIRKKQPGLKVSYLMGKRGMCPLPGGGDVYRRCEGVRTYSSSLMRDRAEKGSLIPAKDPFIRQQIRRMDKEHPLICPHFILSRMFVTAENGQLRMVPSPPLRSKSDRIVDGSVPPKDLGGFSEDLCPYELMLVAARNADLIILNYHHIFDRAIREQLYLSLGIEPQDALLLIDEAHNCGETIQSIESVSFSERDVEQVSRELLALRRRSRSADAIAGILPRITDFITGLKNSAEPEDWFDPTIFDRMIVRGSLYNRMDEIVDDLFSLTDVIREKNTKAGEYHETATERLTTFLFRLNGSVTDPAFLTVYRRQEEGVMLEVRSIDPGPALTEICSLHAGTLLISGTLSPVESFSRYFFGDAHVATLTLTGTFPRKNRLLLAADDITTAYSMRQDRQNTARITDYILSFASVSGNCAIYFPSYQILEQYAALCSQKIKGKQVFIEPRVAADAGAALMDFLALPEQNKAGVLFAVCGGKWSEGLDYRGEMLSGAMVVGLPLAPFTRVRKMVIEYFSRKFPGDGEFLSYTLPAINRALQALGRVLRTPDDRGILVLGERRFLEKQVRSALPAWMLEEMVICNAERFKKEVLLWK
ncbi:MAG: ATP-dependent DNA helicase [Methanoregula sp. PtaU1.Bin051]|nr:MAG: ATP-dependent DNA helicase [Methanoregula sp. PtaU1.Bin051]